MVQHQRQHQHEHEIGRPGQAGAVARAPGASAAAGTAAEPPASNLHTADLHTPDLHTADLHIDELHSAEFHYTGGALQAEGIAIADLAARYGTPFYCYSAAAIRTRLATCRAALAGLDISVCFAVKANGNLSILRLLAGLGAGADVVSGGELARALAAGIPPGRIVYSGVGKRDSEIRAAITAGIAHINVESEAELERIAALAQQAGRIVPVLLRVNPDVAPQTHAKIATGMAQSKFGIAWGEIERLYARAAALPQLAPLGLATHIGSQIHDPGDFRAAFRRLSQLVAQLRERNLQVGRLDLGGGLGIDYLSDAPADFAGYAKVIRQELGDCGCALVIEPGRALIARAGILVTQVILTKPSAGGGHFVIVDAAMNDFLRPALYDARHRIVTVQQDTAGRRARCHIAGPVCESSDVFLRDLGLALPSPGRLLAVCDTGAYGAVLASSYNARPLIAEILVDGDRHAVIRQPQPVAALLAIEPVAPWLVPAPD